VKLSLAVGVYSLLALAACGGTSNSSGFGNDASTSSANDNGSNDGGNGNPNNNTVDDGSVANLGGNVGEAGSNTNGCSAASQLVYVLSSTNDIYSFDPPTQTFAKISTLQCSPPNGMTPNSMAVDREGNAWVNYVASNGFSGEATSGAIYKVVIATGACTATNISLQSGWYQVGMGYSTVSATDTTDTLYVTATNGGAGCQGGGLLGGSSKNAGLGSIDTDAGTLTPIGPFSGSLAGQSAELTGTGDGRLYGFFVLSPVEVAQINKGSGATSNAISVAGVPCPSAWAFSFWGGDFYLYTSPDGITPSTVTHYATGDGGIDTTYATASFVIVGAGVSTCAPTTQPPAK